MIAFWLGIIVLLVTFLDKRLISSPVARIPGPWHTALCSLAIKYHEFAGARRVYVHRLHQRYGPVVRLAPNEVSFSGFEAVKEIYASGGSGYDKTEFYSLFKQFGIRCVITSFCFLLLC